MSLWGNKPAGSAPTPAPRPGIPAGPTPKWSSKPAPQPVSKPVPKPGILGEHGASSFGKMKYFAKNQAYAPAPGYGRKIGKQEHMKMIDTVKKYSTQLFDRPHGIGSTEQYHAILKKMEADKRNMRYTPGYGEKMKKMDQMIKTLKTWEKTKK